MTQEDTKFTAGAGSDKTPAPASYWDAQDMGCGDLVLELRQRLNALNPGEILRLRALDPGAPEDIPAWCRMTGHLLVRQSHPHYDLKRRSPS